MSSSSSSSNLEDKESSLSSASLITALSRSLIEDIIKNSEAATVSQSSSYITAVEDAVISTDEIKKDSLSLQVYDHLDYFSSNCR